MHQSGGPDMGRQVGSSGRMPDPPVYSSVGRTQIESAATHGEASELRTRHDASRHQRLLSRERICVHTPGLFAHEELGSLMAPPMKDSSTDGEDESFPWATPLSTGKTSRRP